MTSLAKRLEESTAKIFDFLYLVRVPQVISMSAEAITRLGVRISGNPDIDRELADQKITTMLSIARLATLHSEGIPIYVIKFEDTSKIYQSVTNHLELWKEALSTLINVGNAPIEDLIKLDQFANTLYPHSKLVMDQPEFKTALDDYYEQFMPLKNSGFFGNEGPSSRDGVTYIGGEPVKPRKGMTDFFHEAERSWGR